MEKLYVALAALIGGLAAAVLGWIESKEPFEGRKFGGSAVRALVAAAVFAAGYELYGRAGVLDLLYAFLGGAGVDVLGNRLAGKLGNGSFPMSNVESSKLAGSEESDGPPHKKES